MDVSRPKRRWLPAVMCTAISFGAFAAVWGLRAGGRLQSLELKCYDLLVRNHRPHPSMADKVVVIGLTEDEISSKRVSFPISDNQLAAVLETLLKSNPRAVGVDLVRDVEVISPEEVRAEMAAATQPATQTAVQAATQPTEPPPAAGAAPSPAAKSAGRLRLEAVWLNNERSDRVVMGSVISKDRHLIGKADVFPEERIGLADYTADGDQVIRRGLLAAQTDRGSYPSIPSLLAQMYLAQEEPPILLEPVPPGDPNAQDLKLGKTTFWHLRPNDGAYVGADAGGIQFLLDYKDPPEGFAHYTVDDVLKNRVPPSAIEGKVVLIGMTAAPTLKDYLNTPLDPLPDLGIARYGVDVHASAVAQLLRAALYGDRPTRSWPEAIEALWVLLFTAGGGAVGFALRSPWKIALTLAAGAVVLAAACWAAFAAGWWVPFLPNLLGWTFAAFGTVAYISYRERADRQVVQKMLAVNVSDEVARDLWDKRDQILKDGRIAAQPVTATVLFTDLKGFSGVSENMTADRLMRWLNELMEALAEDVYNNGGMVNKYIGDAVMAVFGVPVPRTTRDVQRVDAANAVRCALDMRATLERLNCKWKTEGFPEIGMRIGVFTGELVAGQLGSAKRRLEYTVIGDTVNTASRLESFNKYLMDPDISGYPAVDGQGCRILIGQPTYELLDGSFRTRSIGEMELSGKKIKVAVHGVVGRGPAPAAGATAGGPAGDGPVPASQAAEAVKV